MAAKYGKIRQNTEKQKRMVNSTKIFMQNATPPDSDIENPVNRAVESQHQLNSPVDGRVLEGSRRAEKNRRRKNILIKEKDKTIEELKARVRRYQKLLSKIKSKKNIESPTKTKVDLIMKGDASEIKKNLLFGEVMKKQLSDNYKNLRSHSEKQVFAKVVSGDAVRKYKVLSKENILPEKKERAISNETELLKINRKERSDKISEGQNRR